ncbi:MAG: hypothetical protein FJZ90_15035 [Chloroflexi bacterium]|nr:hypothetical protein [Chloroflexota bacterium]
MHHGLVRALRARGVDVLTALEAEMIERSDADHLRYAAANGRVLCSYNARDYHHLHGEYLRQQKAHAGIILMPQQRYSVGEQMRRLLRIVAERSADEIRNRVEFLSAWAGS